MSGGFRIGPRIRLRPGAFRLAGTSSAMLDAWRHVAGELTGRIETDRRGRPQRLSVPHREWLVIVDIYVQSSGESTTTYTRVRSLFERFGTPFRLKVTKRYPFHGLARLVGVKPVAVGYDRVDRALWVRSDRPDVARSLLRGTSLGQSLIRSPVKLLVTRPERRIRRAAGDAVGEVQLLKRGRVAEISTLREMIQICMETLDGLVRFAVATDAAVTEVAI